MNPKLRDAIAHDRTRFTPLPSAGPTRQDLRTAADDALTTFLAAGGNVTRIATAAAPLERSAIEALGYRNALSLARQGKL
jgi:hypothetical protein